MTNSGFIAGTEIHTDKGLVPIQDIQVGDMVLSSPESGKGELVYKPVTNTFCYDDKEVWIIELEKHWDRIDPETGLSIIKFEDFDKLISEDYMVVTPNHPICIVGDGVFTDAPFEEDEVTYYETPQWKSVAQVKHFDLMISKEGIKYVVRRVQPLCKLKCEQQDAYDPNVAWFQENYRYIGLVDKFEDLYKNGFFGEEDRILDDLKDQELSIDDYTPDMFADFEVGDSYSLAKAKESSPTYGRYKGLPDIGLNIVNNLKDDNGNYYPYKAPVYNLEVADHHTYYVGKAAVLVHNSSA